jgi:hypothetical protein
MVQHIDIGKTMTILINYVLNTKDYELNIEPTRTEVMFTLEQISSSEYAGDTNTLM